MKYHGRIVGRYTVVRCLGSGGMGSVWASRDNTLGRDVAIKFIRPEAIANELARRRFQRELVAMLELSHPNIVRMLDAGSADGEPYLVMELVAGQTLEELLKPRTPLDRARCVSIARELLEALAHMHARGFAHRDIKPANVMLERSGRTVLMDLGLVKALDRPALTRTGAVVGTPRWMAPEMLAGAPCDVRVDVYQAGFLLAEVLTGRPPFGPEELLRFARGDLTAEPDVSAVAKVAGPALAALVANALAPRVERRYLSAAMMLEDLEAIETGGRARSLPVATEVAGHSLVRLPDSLRQRYTVLAPLPSEPPVAQYSAVDRCDGTSVHLHVLAARQPAADALLALRELAGPGLVLPREAVRAEGSVFLLFPAPSGGTLADRLGTDDHLPPAAFARAVLTLTAALAGLHARGRAHGHIGPVTIRLAPAGDASLSGLELAILETMPAVDGAAGERDPSETRRVSVFAAPEEMAGAQPSPRGDVFAAGRALQNFQALLDPPGLGDASAPWTEAIARATDRDPSHRHADGAALWREMEEVLARYRAPIGSRARRVGGMTAAALAPLVALAAATGVRWWPAADPPRCPRVVDLVVDYRYGSMALSMSTKEPSRPRVSWWAAGRPATISVEDGPVATRAHSIRMAVAHPMEDLRCRIEWWLAGSTSPVPGELPVPSAARGTIDVEGPELSIAGLERRLFMYRAVAEELAGGPAAPARAGSTELEAVLADALADRQVDARLRDRAYSIFGLLDLARARPDLGRLLPPHLSWCAVPPGEPDRVLAASLARAGARERPLAARPRLEDTTALSLELDEDPDGLAAVRLVAEPSSGIASWRGRFLAISVNGSTALILRDRGSAGPGHTFDPLWLRPGTNRLLVTRGVTGEPIDGPDPGAWRIKLELYRRRSGS